MTAGPPLTRLVLYVKDIPRVAEFYTRHFGFSPLPHKFDDLLEIRSADERFALLLHQASKGHRVGQSNVKLVFDVDDIEAFKLKAKAQGLVFGKTHRGDGFEFANARDPAKNPIQISRSAYLT